MLVDVRGRRRVVIVGREGGVAYDPVAALLALSPHTLCIPFAENLREDEDGTGSVEATDAVGWIDDLTGNLHIPVQADVGERPTYNPSGSLHLLTCDGTDDQLAVNFADLAQPFEIVAALRIVTSSGGETMIGGGATNNFGAIFIDGSNINLFAGSAMTGPAQPANGVDFVVTAKFNGASSRVKVNNDAYVTGDAGAQAMTGLSIGTGVGSGFANILFYGVMVRPGEMSDGEAAAALTAMGFLAGLTL